MRNEARRYGFDPFRFPLTEDRSTNRVERARDAHRVVVKVAHRRFLKENDGIKGLILGAGGDIRLGQCGQEVPWFCSLGISEGNIAICVGNSVSSRHSKFARS